jgi:CheY-like chemotaxis protein
MTDGEISVLLVEPDPQAAQLLLLQLAAPDARRFEAIRVESVEDGRRVLERAEPVAAALVGLPLEGGRLRERLRTLRRAAPELPVIAAVEAGAEELGREAVALGAACFWVKGGDARALKRALVAAVGCGASSPRAEAASLALVPAPSAA